MMTERRPKIKPRIQNLVTVLNSDRKVHRKQENMMRTRVLVGLVCGAVVACLACANAAAATFADFGTDFTGTVNPHADSIGTGTWSYYRSDTVDPSDPGANLTAYVWNAGNSEFKDPAATYGQVRQTDIHPATGNFTVVRWQAGQNGPCAVTGFFQRENNTDGGNGVSVFVYVDGTLQASISSDLPAAVGNPMIAFNFATDIDAGQYIDFVVDPKGDFSFDRTDFDVSIKDLTPEITNGSFEVPDYEPAPGTEGGTTVTGWEKEEAAYGSPGIQIDGKSDSPAAADGDQWCFVNLVASLSGSGGNTGSVWQDVGFARAGSGYTLDFTLGNRSASIAPTSTVSLWRGGTSPSVADGSTLIGQEAVVPPGGGDKTTYKTTFEPGTGFGYETLWLRFDFSVPAGASGTNHQMLLDAVGLAYTKGLVITIH